MFSSKNEQRTTMTREEMSDVTSAIEIAIDKFFTSLDSDYRTFIGSMLIDFATSYKLTYILTPASIKRIIDMHMHRDPYRDAIEDMAAHFIANLNSVDEVLPMLVRTLAAACSVHKTSSLLPRALVEEMVSREDAENVLANETWLLFITSVTAYCTTSMLDDILTRNKIKG